MDTYPIHQGSDIAETLHSKAMRSEWPAAMKVGLLDLANEIQPDVEYVNLSEAPGTDWLMMFAPISADVPTCGVWLVEDTETGETLTRATFTNSGPMPGRKTVA